MRTDTVLLLILALDFTLFAKVDNKRQYDTPLKFFHYLEDKLLGTQLNYFYIVFMFLLFTMLIAAGILFEVRYQIRGIWAA